MEQYEEKMDTASDIEEDDGIVGYERLDEEKTEKLPGNVENVIKVNSKNESKITQKVKYDNAMKKPNQVDQYGVMAAVNQINPIKPKEPVQKNDLKKIKVSLSQDQIKSNMKQTNDVTRIRSNSFTLDRKAMSIYFPKVKHNLIPTVITQDIFEEVDSPKEEVKEVENKILIVPRIEEPVNFTPKHQTLKPVASSVSKLSVQNPDIRTSFTSLASGVSGVLSGISVESSTPFKPFKYPEELQCKICLNLLKDPRILDCLHSFCLQCLIDMDSFNGHGPNHWRNVSGDVSEFEFSSVIGKPESVLSRSSHESEKNIEKRLSISRGRSFIRTTFKSKSPSSPRSHKPRHSSIVSYTEKPKDLICATCGYRTEIANGIYRLIQNVILNRKIKAIIYKDEANKIWCRLCTSESLAVANCVTCGMNLCTFCKEAHKRQRTTSGHVIKMIVDSKKSKKFSVDKSMEIQAVKCLIHLTHDMKLFCCQCNQVICSDCTIILHRGHKVTSVSKASKVYIKLLKDSLERTKPLNNYAIYSISKLNDVSKKCKVKCEIVENEVDQYLTDYFEALEVHKKTLKTQIARAKETKIDTIRAQQVDLERRSTEAKTAISFTEELLKGANDVDSMIFVNMLLKRFAHLNNSDASLDVKTTDSLQFLPQIKAPANQLNIPLYGIITTQTPSAKFCSLETTDGLMNLRVNKKAELIVLTRDKDERKMCHGGATVDVNVRYNDVSFKNISVHVTDKRDGTYVINFLPEQAGALQITIQVNGKAIKNSPFNIRARNLRPHPGIFHCCTFCSSNGNKKTTCACGGIMEGYAGCGHGHGTAWPGGRHWNCCGNILENSECTLANAIINE